MKSGAGVVYGLIALGLCVWLFISIPVAVIGAVQGNDTGSIISTPGIGICILLAVVFIHSTFGGTSKVGAESLRPSKWRQGNPERIFSESPFLRDATNAFSAPTYFLDRWLRPASRLREREVVAVRKALVQAAMWERQRRGYPIQDHTGQLMSPTMTPDGILVDEVIEPNGAISRVLAYDFEVQNSPASMEDVAIRLGDRRGTMILRHVSSGELQQARTIGLAGYVSEWADLYALQPSDTKSARWVRIDYNDMARGAMPLFKPKLRQVSVTTGRPGGFVTSNPGAQRGSAEFYFPEAHRRSLTREQWVSVLADRIRPEVARRSGLTVPPCQVSYNTKRFVGTRAGWIGSFQIRPAQGRAIDIHPTVADPMEIAGIIAHEFLHAALPDVSHGPPFERAARLIGLEGKIPYTVAGKAFRSWVDPILRQLPPFPQAS